MGSVDFMAEAPTIFALKLFAVISPVKVREEAPVNSTFSNADRLTSAVNFSLFFPLILPSKVMSSIPSCFSVKFSCFSSRAGMVTDAPVDSPCLAVTLNAPWTSIPVIFSPWKREIVICSCAMAPVMAKQNMKRMNVIFFMIIIF